MRKGCALLAAAIVVIIIALANLGENVSTEFSKSSGNQEALLDDAKAALSMQLSNPSTREIHILTANDVVCGQVKHDESEIGFAPFAYSHTLGLSVAEVWGKGQPERLNHEYGCKFLPIAYTEEWTKPFWGGAPEGDSYIP